MFESYVKSIFLFFYYIFLEEKIALKATRKVLKRQKHLLAKLPNSSMQSQLMYSEIQEGIANQEIVLLLITSCLQIWKKYQRYSFSRNKSEQPLRRKNMSSGVNFIPSIDLEPWCDFLRETEDEVVLVVILSKILLFKDEDIAKAMKISIGTVKYRLGYGLRCLGNMSPSGVQFIGVTKGYETTSTQ